MTKLDQKIFQYLFKLPKDQILKNLRKIPLHKILQYLNQLSPELVLQYLHELSLPKLSKFLLKLPRYNIFQLLNKFPLDQILPILKKLTGDKNIQKFFEQYMLLFPHHQPRDTKPIDLSSCKDDECTIQRRDTSSVPITLPNYDCKDDECTVKPISRSPEIPIRSLNLSCEDNCINKIEKLSATLSSASSTTPSAALPVKKYSSGFKASSRSDNVRRNMYNPAAPAMRSYQLPSQHTARLIPGQQIQGRQTPIQQNRQIHSLPVNMTQPAPIQPTRQITGIPTGSMPGSTTGVPTGNIPGSMPGSTTGVPTGSAPGSTTATAIQRSASSKIADSMTRIPNSIKQPSQVVEQVSPATPLPIAAAPITAGIGVLIMIMTSAFALA
jgi:hypothetical protein